MMSATISNLDEFIKYLESLCKRKIKIVKWGDRPVPLKFSTKGIKIKNVEDSIIFAFSRKDIDILIESIVQERVFFPDQINKKDIKEIAFNHKVDIMDEWGYGISKYHGMLLPKEKKCVEYLYRAGFINTIVGTDSLSLGVNFPAKKAIFGQLTKSKEILSPSEFYQMSGRAGRYGYHDEGLVSYLKNSPVFGYDLNPDEVFKKLVNSELEDSTIDVNTDIKTMLNGRYIEDEIDYQIEFRFPKISNIFNIRDYYYQKIKNDLKIIDDYKEKLRCFNGYHYTNDWYELLKQTYLPEYKIDFNCKIVNQCLNLMCVKSNVDTCNLIDFVLTDVTCKGEELKELLLLRKYLNNFKIIDNYRLINYDLLIDNINTLDQTVLNV